MPTETLELQVSDISGQHRYDAKVPTDTSVQELLQALVKEMDPPRTDPNGRPTTYSLLHEKEGRQLNPNETVGNAVERGDRIVLSPSIDAGFSGSCH